MKAKEEFHTELMKPTCSPHRRLFMCSCLHSITSSTLVAADGDITSLTSLSRDAGSVGREVQPCPEPGRSPRESYSAFRQQNFALTIINFAPSIFLYDDYL